MGVRWARQEAPQAPPVVGRRRGVLDGLRPLKNHRRGPPSWVSSLENDPGSGEIGRGKTGITPITHNPSGAFIIITGRLKPLFPCARDWVRMNGRQTPNKQTNPSKYAMIDWQAAPGHLAAPLGRRVPAAAPRDGHVGVGRHAPPREGGGWNGSGQPIAVNPLRTHRGLSLIRVGLCSIVGTSAALHPCLAPRLSHHRPDPPSILV